MSEVAAADEKRGQVEKLLTDIFSLMEYPTRLDFKDASDGGIAVALHFDGEVPGITPGKKSYLVDSIQFLVNKVVNRPNTEKRWVSLGVGAFPEPRPSQPQPAPSQPQAQVPAEKKADAPARGGRNGSEKNGSAAGKPAAQDKAAPQQPRREQSRGPDELTMEVAADDAVAKLGTALAEKAAKYGRHYAVLGMTTEARAVLLQAAKAKGGVNAKAEGDSYLRRATVLSQKPTPMPKKAALELPEDDDEE